MKSCFVCLTMAIFINVAGAADLAILRAGVNAHDHRVSVEMNATDPPIQTGDLGARQWKVEIFNANGDSIPGIDVVDVNILKTPAGIPTDLVALDLTPSAMLDGWNSLLVTYKNGSSKTLQFLGTPREKPKTMIGANSKDSSDVYVSGSYSPSINSPAQYSYDVAVAYAFPYFSPTRPKAGRAGVSITAAADQRPNLDPNSYHAGLFWQSFLVTTNHGPLLGVEFQVASAGEFALKKLGGAQTMTTNFIAPYPRFDFPMRLYPPRGPKKDITLTARPMVSFEYGKNFQNAQQPNGSGLIARWVAGIDTSLTYKPQRPFLHSLSLSSSWQGRYLEESEIDTTSKFNPTTQNFDFAFRLTRKPRNHVSSKLEWKWTEYFGFTVSHELGVVPPLFNYVDHSIALGFTFSAAFPRNAAHLRQ